MKQLKTAMNARMILMAAGLFLLFNAVTTTSQEGLRWFNIVHLITQYDEDVASGKIQPSVDVDAEEKSGTAAEADETTVDTENEEASSGDAKEDNASGETAAKSETDATQEAVASQEAATESQEIDIPALKTEMETLGITLSDLRLMGIACYVMTLIRIFAGVVCVRFSNRVDRAGITLKTVIGLIAVEIIYILFQFFKRALFLGSVLYTVIICGALLWGALKMKKLAEEDPERIYAVQPAARKSANVQPAPKKSLRDKAMMNTSSDLDDTSDHIAGSGNDIVPAGKNVPDSDDAEQ